MHVYTDGTVLISHGGCEMGQGLHTKVCQVAARAFGIPLSACHVADTATDKVANSITSAGSLSTDLYGMATLDACRQILRRLKPLREAVGAKASLAELATAAYFSRIDLSAHGYFALDERRCGFDFRAPPGVKPDGTPDQAARGLCHNYFTQGVGCVEVEIDVLTGDHEVRRADLLVDVGSSINPALDIGQVEGGFTQGMGWTTTEELLWGDDTHGWVQPRGGLHLRGPGTCKTFLFNHQPIHHRRAPLARARHVQAAELQRYAARAARAPHVGRRQQGRRPLVQGGGRAPLLPRRGHLPRDPQRGRRRLLEQRMSLPRTFPEPSRNLPVGRRRARRPRGRPLHGTPHALSAGD